MSVFAFDRMDLVELVGDLPLYISLDICNALNSE